MDAETIKQDLKIMKELLEIENRYIDCVMKLINHYNKYKPTDSNYKEKYLQQKKEINNYKNQLYNLQKLSKPLISKSKMDRLLYEQNKIKSIIDNIKTLNLV